MSEVSPEPGETLRYAGPSGPAVPPQIRLWRGVERNPAEW